MKLIDIPTYNFLDKILLYNISDVGIKYTFYQIVEYTKYIIIILICKSIYDMILKNNHEYNHYVKFSNIKDEIHDMLIRGIVFIVQIPVFIILINLFIYFVIFLFAFIGYLL